MATLIRNYLPAQIVEKLVEQELNASAEDRIINSTPWANGRENGFKFSVWVGSHFRSIYVAENRNSFQLTATVSEFSDWDRVTDEEYRSRKFFDHDKYLECAQFVVASLLQK